ncbi:hypothetical protein Salat_0644700 [Sesamum alatum]|uniref:DUF4283 domain-containing protein n=1 Tax=Sesamum alatum TaxID=300844 RepID=A0AAE1YSE4_9LAMI|nr:hypothetical protein Salat_0644700 [Sesamum alatum]
MADTAGGLPPLTRSYRDAVAGVDVRPPPPPISFDSASFRSMGTLTRDQGMKVLRFSDDEIARLSQPFRYALVGKFSHSYPSMQNLRRWMLAQGFRGDFSVGAINFRHVFIKFTLEEDYTKLWIKPIWFVEGFPMRVFKSTPTVNPRVESPIVPQEALFSIARLLGTPLRTDVSTTTLVRPSVARVCVEINLLEPLQTEIGLGFGTDVVIQRVVYERLPKYCGACKHLGHAEEECYEKHKAKVLVRPMEKDSQQKSGPAREDLRVKLDAQRATSGAKEDGKETCGDVLHTDTPEPVMEEVVHTPEIVTGGTEVLGPILATSQDLEEPAFGQGSDDPVEMRTEVQQAGGHIPVAPTADPPREELPRCVENKSVWDMPYSANDIEDDIFTMTGAGSVQTDDVDVSRRVARHRRGRSMEDDPLGESALPDYGQAASPPRRRVTRSTAGSTLRY